MLDDPNAPKKHRPRLTRRALSLWLIAAVLGTLGWLLDPRMSSPPAPSSAPSASTADDTSIDAGPGESPRGVVEFEMNADEARPR